MNGDQLLLSQVAKLVGIKNYQLAYLLTSGAVEEPKLRIGGRRVFDKHDVERVRRVVAERATRKEARP